MPGKRIAMRNIRDVLRLRLDAQLSIRQISASTKVSVGAAQKLLKEAQSLGLSWPLTPSDSPPTTWFEVTSTNLAIQLEQPLAPLAAFANPT